MDDYADESQFKLSLTEENNQHGRHYLGELLADLETRLAQVERDLMSDQEIFLAQSRTNENVMDILENHTRLIRLLDSLLAAKEK